MVSNMLAWRNAESLTPAMFSDAEHFVQSLVDRVAEMARKGIMNAKAAMFMTLLGRLASAKAWQACFNNVAELGEDYRVWIKEGPIPTMFAAPAKSDSPDKQGGNSKRERPSINPACSSLTGKLKTCGWCGTLESRKQEYRCCSRCWQVQYCSKKCQKRAWKTHKNECNEYVARQAANSDDS